MADPAKDVRGNVEEAVRDTRLLLTRFEEISARFAEPMSDDEMNALLEKQGEIQTRIEAIGAWERDRKIDIAMDALRLPTAQETQELVDRLSVLTNRSTEGLQATALSSGAVTVNLEGRFESVMLVRPNADGTSEVRCVTSFDEAADFLGLVEDKSQQ
jgi:hypothetical protein